MPVKSFIVTSILLSAFTVATSQDTTAASIISNLQGIVINDVTFFECEGYEIFLQLHKENFDDKGINKVKRKYSIPAKLQSDSSFEGRRFVMVRSKDSVFGSGVYYFYPDSANKITAIGLVTTMKRDEQLERIIWNAIRTNTVPDSVFTPREIGKIKFADRTIELGPLCRWMQVRNVQCPNRGQMNWSEFRTLERAKEGLESQYNATKEKGKMIEEKKVNVEFEGIKTEALMRRIKIGIPKFITGVNQLIIYYVVVPVRDKYVACVLSHYVDEAKDGELPPLLSEVMKLK